MAQQNLVLGAADNDGNGEGLRDTFLKVQANTTELYAGKLEFITPPTSATDTGVAGQVAYDGSFFYVCTATNIWVRTALATW